MVIQYQNSYLSPPSLSRDPLIDTTDLDEARAMFRQLYGVGSIDFDPRRAQFSWHATQGQLDPITLFVDSVPGGVRLEAKGNPNLNYVLVCSLRGRTAFQHGKVEGGLHPGSWAALLGPHWPLRMKISASTLHGVLVIKRRSLEEHFTKLTGVTLRQPLQFAPSLDLSDPRSATFVRMASLALHELAQPGGLVSAPLLARSYAEALLTALLEMVPHDRSGLLEGSAQPVAPACVKRAEDYIDAHADEPISIPDVAAALGVSVRSLEKAFRRFRGCSPLDHLKVRRLERARALLLAPEPGTTVKSVAHAIGYRHAGYFIKTYRRCFDETPGETLRRAK